MSGERIDIYFMEDEERALQADAAGSGMRRKLMIRNTKVSMPVVNYRGDTKMPGK